jgi:hypothetical protein
MTKRERQEAEFAQLLAECHAAGRESSKSVPDVGCCGWAWVNIPANVPFGRWIKKTSGKKGQHPFGRSSGTRIDCEYSGQAIAGQMAYADGIVAVLKNKGIEAFAWQRYD